MSSRRPAPLTAVIALLAIACCGLALAQSPQVVPGDPGGIGRAQLSDDGRWVVWADTDGTCCATVTPFVYRSDLQNGSVTELNLHLTTGNTELEFSGTMFPRINRDGTRITVIADDRSDAGGSGRSDLLLVLDETGQELLRVRALDEFGDVTDFFPTAPIDPAGRFVAFSVTASVINAETADGTRFRYEYPGNLFFPGNVQSIFRVDVVTAEIELVYLDSGGNEPSEDGWVHQIGGNGRYISYSSFATDLPDANGGCQLYRRDMEGSINGGSILVSRDGAGQPVSDIWQCDAVDITRTDMSADGTALAYTEASGGTPDGDPRAFLWRQGSGSTELAAVNAEEDLALSATAAWLSPSDDAFLRLDIGSGVTDPINFRTRYTDISEDGRVVLFNSNELTPPAGQQGEWWILTYDDTPVDDTAPSWPPAAELALSATGSDVSLSWPAASDDTAVTEYVVFRGGIEIERVAAPTTSTTDPGLPDATYGYRVEAADAAGNVSDDGPASSITVDTSDSVPPAWPGGTLTATQVGALGVLLEWSAAIDAGSGVKEYVVYRDNAEIARTPTRSLGDTVPALGTYAYRVEAVDGAFNESVTGPATVIDVLAPPIEIAIEERIRVNDEGVNVLAALTILVEETITVLDASTSLPAIVLEILETVTVQDVPEVSTPAVGPPPGSDLIVIDIPNPPLFPGASFTASAEGFKPLSLVRAFLESTPVLVGEETADAAGRVTFLITIPRDFPPGPHTVVLVGTGLDGAERRLTAAIRVNPLPVDGVPVPTLRDGALALLALLMMAIALRRLGTGGRQHFTR